MARAVLRARGNRPPRQPSSAVAESHQFALEQARTEFRGPVLLSLEPGRPGLSPIETGCRAKRLSLHSYVGFVSGKTYRLRAHSRQCCAFLTEKPEKPLTRKALASAPFAFPLLRGERMRGGDEKEERGWRSYRPVSHCPAERGNGEVVLPLGIKREGESA